MLSTWTSTSKLDSLTPDWANDRIWHGRCVHDMWLILIKDIWWLKWDLGKGKTCSNSHILWSYYSRHLIIPTHSSKSSSVKRFFPTLLFDMECESSFKGRGKRSSFPLSKPAAKTRKTSIKKGSVHHYFNDATPTDAMIRNRAERKCQYVIRYLINQLTNNSINM